MRCKSLLEKSHAQLLRCDITRCPNPSDDRVPDHEDYAAVEVAMKFTLAMLLLRLLLGALSSLCAGFFAAWIAKGNRVAVTVLAGLLLIAFIPVHYTLWERFPVWYHLTFLLSLVVATVLGAVSYLHYVWPGREHLARENGNGPK